MIALAEGEGGTILPVKARPGARRDALLGAHGGSLRVAVIAAPERGRANAAILGLLAQALALKGSQLRLISGEASRDKRFLIEGLDLAEVRRRLAAATEPGAS